MVTLASIKTKMATVNNNAGFKILLQKLFLFDPFLDLLLMYHAIYIHIFIFMINMGNLISALSFSSGAYQPFIFLFNSISNVL